MEITYAIIILLLVVAGWCLLMKMQTPTKEGISGFGVTSGLAFNNRLAYCQEGNEKSGGSWSGGCFLPHRVII